MMMCRDFSIVKIVTMDFSIFNSKLMLVEGVPAHLHVFPVWCFVS